MSEQAPIQTVQAPAPQQQQPANSFHLQRKCMCGSYAGGGECDKCRDEGRKVQRVAINRSTPNAVPAIVNDVLGLSGQPLDAATRSFMEPRFGHDFSNVRVHTDARAAQSAQAVNALAFTVGRDVVFGAGQYAPGTVRGSQLLAHELTHVVQQAGSGYNTRQNAKPISDPSDAAEVEADDATSKIFAGEPFVPVRQPPNATIHALSPDERDWAIFGGIVGAIGIGVGIAALAGAFSSNDQQRAANSLADLLRRIQPACQANATAEQRQEAVNALVAWARPQSSLGIDWSRIDWVHYDTSVGAKGSMTNAEDTNHIKISLGPEAFSSPENLYSTFRHELVHVQEHETRPRSEIESRGIGVQEIYAYLWELEHQNETGLARRENWGLRADGTADRTKGLARVVDGVFRALISMADDLGANPSAVPMTEQIAIERRVACAMTQTPREVVQAVLPQAPLDQWRRECSEGVQTPQPKLSPHANLPFNELSMSAPESPAEREADHIANRIAQGWTTNSIHESIPQIGVHRSATGLGGLGTIPADEGMPFPVPAREFFETGFGRSFDNVRIHTDAPAARSAQSFQADAFTVGRDIYFGAGKFDPESTGGRHLIAHELTHTIQQQGGAQSIMRQASSGPATDPTASPAPAAAPAADTGPGNYDGCPEPQSIMAARGDAAARVAHAVDVLAPANISSAAPLLRKHFHVDVSRPESAATIALIRGQFSRMATGLNSGIRIFCRSAPRTGTGMLPSQMPSSDGCRGLVHANSTNCANNDPSATVQLCEMRIMEGGDPLVKTIIHEFAHIACDGNPAIAGAGVERYYEPPNGLPGEVSDVLINADSYAWFAIEASGIQVASPARDGGTNRRARSRLPWLAVLGVGLGLGIGGIFAPGLLVGAGAGLLIGALGLAGAFE